VLGARAQGPILRALSGSVGNEVADAAACDVLLVPAGASAPKRAA
jgi:nucleotide-binding universal stress UspA family protein